MSRLANKLEEIYASAKVEDKGGRMLSLEPDLEKIMKDVKYNNWDDLKWAWKAWRDATGPKMKQSFARLVELSNEGAIQSGK